MEKININADSTSPVWLMVRAYEVSRRLISYGAYDSRDQTLKALRRFCKGHYSEAERSEALSKAVHLMKVVIAVVDANAGLLHAQSNRADLEFEDWNDPELMDKLTAQVREKCPAFYSDEYKNPTGIYRLAISWVFFWHHITGKPTHLPDY